MEMAETTSLYHRHPCAALEAVQRTGAGKYVLVTGAARDIGRTIALSWAKAGAAGIAICSQNAEDLEQVIAELRRLNPAGKVFATACDTTRSADVTKLFLTIREQFGKLDIVIANVGTAHSSTIGETNDNDEWWADMTTNFRSTHLPAHQYIRTFGLAPTGTFISITSGTDTVVSSGLSSHQIAKDADRRLIEFLNTEYPEMKAFSLDVGSIRTERMFDMFEPLAFDNLELIGMFSVWLGGGRADKLKGTCVHVTWNVGELENRSENLSRKDSLLG